MLATEQLKHDHEVILRLLAVVEAAANEVRQGKSLSPDFLPKAIDVIRNFVDRCHHAKEEEYLFPALERRGMPTDSGPIKVMLGEHEQGRSYVRVLDQDVARTRAGTLSEPALENIGRYVALLRSHINKEDNVLFPMADDRLSLAEQEKLHEQFEEIEESRIGPGMHEEYVKMIEGWEHDFGLAQHYRH